jgi:hypothetical protein
LPLAASSLSASVHVSAALVHFSSLSQHNRQIQQQREFDHSVTLNNVVSIH